MRYDFRQFFREDISKHGLRAALGTLVWNLRFTLGYRLGDFTSAKRDY